MQTQLTFLVFYDREYIHELRDLWIVKWPSISSSFPRSPQLCAHGLTTCMYPNQADDVLWKGYFQKMIQQLPKHWTGCQRWCPAVQLFSLLSFFPFSPHHLQTHRMTDGSSSPSSFQVLCQSPWIHDCCFCCCCSPTHSGMSWAQSLVAMYINADGLHLTTSRFRVFSFTVI